MKIDVVYKLGVGSKYNDLELKYSLRSLSNFKDLGKVYIIGHKPNWIKNVIHFPLQDVFTANKDANLINKLILATQDKDLSRTFLNFSDDQLLMKECSLKDFQIPYYDNTLINFQPDQKLGRWKTRLKNTIRALQERGFSANCYEAHIPVLIIKDLFIQTVFQYPYPEGQGMCGNTLYFNSIGEQGKQLPQGHACRIEGLIEDYNTLKTLCEGRLHFNYAEASINANLFLFLQNNFPNKSIYEND